MRRPSSTARIAVLLVALLVVLGTVPGVVAADDSRAGGTIVVGETETVQGDLRAFGGSVVVYGTVTGDVQAFAGDVVVAGSVGGNVQAFAGSVTITGTVDGSVQGAGGRVTVADGATVDGDLEVGAGSILVAGTVNGDAKLGAETITLAPTAVVNGDLAYDGTLHQQPGSTVTGQVVRDERIGVQFGPTMPRIPAIVGDIYTLLVNLVVGAVLLALFPRFTGTVSRRVREDALRSGLLGLAAGIGGAILVLLLAITIVGIPLALVLAAFLGLTGWTGSILGQYAVGDYVLRRAGREDRWLALVAGLVGFAVLRFVPVLGGLATAIAGLLGFGAVVAALYARYAGTDGESGGRQATLSETT